MTDSAVRTGQQTDWMIYGAYGYTGELVAQEAIRRGHRPVLAGRSGKKLIPLAERLGLEWVELDLCDKSALSAASRSVFGVGNSVGP